MFFLRVVFLILILAGSTSVGFLLSKRYSDRVNELITFSGLINIFQNKIRFTRTPLPEAFEELADIKNNKIISSIFYDFSQNLKIKRCDEAWNESIEKRRNFLSLKEEDINLIKQLGTSLGKTDIDGQMSEINRFNTLLQVQIKKAEEERKKNEKMYKSLGTIIGLAIVIILF